MRVTIWLSGLVILLGATAARAEAPFTDAVAYCQAAGNADAPEARYAGPKVPDWMIPAL
jgi:hypothetical protein